MYTQCPDCRATFLVTPAVLQQAAGNVRCGGCGHAFNALERLSEGSPGDSDGDSGFSDEQRKALLDSLDEITGTDNIRIEDTGVEWRLLDEDAADPEDQEAAADAHLEPAPADTGSPAPEANPQEVLDLPVDEQADAERYDDNTPFPGALDDDADESVAAPDTPRRRAEDLLEPRSPELDERQVDLALSEPEEWTDLLDEVVIEPGDELSLEVVAAGDEPVLEIVPTGDAPTPEIVPAGDEPTPEIVPAGNEAEPDIDKTDTRSLDFPSDIDTQFDLQALELGLGTSGEFDPAGEEPVLDAEELTLVEVDDDPADSRESTGEFDRRIALAAEALARDDGDDHADADVEQALEPSAPAAADTEHYVPPQTEEEMTINRMIDQDLLRLAAEEEGLAATSSGAARIPQNDSPHVETIIMEGDFVRTSLEAEPPPAGTGIEIDIEPPVEDAKPSLRDTYIRARNRLGAGEHKASPPRYALVAGVALLALLLAAQIVHAYRESLATFGTFDETVGSLYRWFGAPITPDWDANGWQFKATSGSTDAFDQVLTISSRIANSSNSALPYPLLHVSLTDRYEEIISSSLLEPDQYLGEAERGDNVAPGDEFIATVTIASLSPEATGFKLNVCYRETLEAVRCATGVFKE